MPFYSFETESEREIYPGFRAKFLHSERMTMGSWEIEAGMELPEHVHEHEQISLLLDGEIEFTMAGETRMLQAGDVVITPSNVVHSGKAITDCKVIDVFSPVREDYRAAAE